MHCLNRQSRQRGVALVLALLLVALGAILTVAASTEHTLLMKRGSNSFVGSQARAYLHGGEDLAKMVLLQDAEEDEEEGEPRDDLTELWAQQVPPYTLDEGGFLTGNLEDLSGRLNLNNLTATPNNEEDRFTAAQAQFLRLLQSFEEPRISEQDARLILEALQDWIDQDREPRDFGAEDDYYVDVEPPYLPANGRMRSVSELRMVAYMTPELFLALEPFVTVWGTGAINIQTAPARILRTINSKDNLQPLSEAEGEALVELRGDEGFESVEAVFESPVLAGLELSNEIRSRFVQRSDYFLYRGQVEVADRTATLYSVLRREPGQVKALVRSSGSL